MEILKSTKEARVPVTILRLSGPLDSASAGYFTEEARKTIEDGAANILIDLSAVPSMSSVGIRCISALYDWLHPVKSAEDHREIAKKIHAGGYHAAHLKLLNPNARILQVIHLVALDRYLDVYSDEEDALAAF